MIEDQIEFYHSEVKRLQKIKKELEDPIDDQKIFEIENLLAQKMVGLAANNSERENSLDSKSEESESLDCSPNNLIGDTQKLVSKEK